MYEYTRPTSKSPLARVRPCQAGSAMSCYAAWPNGPCGLCEGDRSRFRTRYGRASSIPDDDPSRRRRLRRREGHR